jgi:hypothetical protein
VLRNELRIGDLKLGNSGKRIKNVLEDLRVLP